MRRQDAADLDRSILFKQDSHPFEGEPMLAKRRTAFTRSRGQLESLGCNFLGGASGPRVIDNGLSGNTSALDHPGAGYLARHALHVSAL